MTEAGVACMSSTAAQDTGVLYCAQLRFPTRTPTIQLRITELAEPIDVSCLRWNTHSCELTPARLQAQERVPLCAPSALPSALPPRCLPHCPAATLAQPLLRELTSGVLRRNSAARAT